MIARFVIVALLGVLAPADSFAAAQATAEVTARFVPARETVRVSFLKPTPESGRERQPASEKGADRVTVTRAQLSENPSTLIYE